MAEELSQASIALVERPVLAHLATVDPKGRPQVTPVWVDHDGNNLVINTALGRAKANHLEHNPDVSVSIVAPDDNYSVVALRGKVTDITTDGADEHIDSLANKYLGVDKYPMRREGEVRIKVTIEPQHIYMQI
ncbi:MAG: PPOX class F420-dependent oxidoreductase [Acidimicrobiales bacterium]